MSAPGPAGDSLIIAHRGGAGLRPENTYSAFSHALDLGADGVEIDVRLTRDDAVVVFHDDVADPHRTGAGVAMLVRDMSLSQVRAMDVGIPLPGKPASGLAVPGERVPEFGEFLDFMAEKASDATVMVELKTDYRFPHALDPERLTGAVLEALAVSPFPGPVLLMSFDWRCLAIAAPEMGDAACVFLSSDEQTPDAPSSHTPWFGQFAPRRHDGSILRAIKAAGGRIWGPPHEELTPEVIAEAHDAGIALAPWTVDAPRRIVRLFAQGVEFLITDHPDRALGLRPPDHGAADAPKPESKPRPESDSDPDSDPDPSDPYGPIPEFLRRR